MFNDRSWRSEIVDEQASRYYQWLRQFSNESEFNLAIIEIGAGTAVATVRFESETILARFQTHHPASAQLIRINPDQGSSGIDARHSIIRLSLRSLEALQHIATQLEEQIHDNDEIDSAQ